jgi:pimeloyl-ACP methyl ester carboxylesterase
MTRAPAAAAKSTKSAMGSNQQSSTTSKLSIPTPDNHLIYGTLDQPNEKTEKLIVFIHGLTGHQNEHIFYNAVPFFTSRGYAVCRFDFYSGEKGSRLLRESTIASHAQDLQTVLAELRPQFPKIFLVGHSLGGHVIMTAKPSGIIAAVFWDSTHNLNDKLTHDLKLVPELDAYLLEWGVEFLIGRAMRDEWLTAALPSELLKDFTAPLKIILAEQSQESVAAWQQAFPQLSMPKDLVIIKNADHNFNEPRTEADLFQQTLSWLEKF